MPTIKEAATEFLAHKRIAVTGRCPLMFDPTADFGHKVMRMVLSSRMPKTV